MSEEMQNQKRPDEPRIDCIAKKSLAKWSGQIVEEARKKDPQLVRNNEKFTPILIDRLTNRTLLEAEFANKILVKAHFPLQAFVRETGHNINSEERSDLALGLISCLPETIEVNETWIAYADGSMIVVSTPTEPTLSAIRFIEEMSKNKEAAAILGLTGEDIGNAHQLIRMAISNRLLFPYSAKEFSQFMQARLNQYFPEGAEPQYQINMSSEIVPPAEMVRILIEFSESPTDTLKKSTETYLKGFAKESAEAARRKSHDEDEKYHFAKATN